MSFSVTMSDVGREMRGFEDDLAKSQTLAMRELTGVVQTAWREQTQAAGLGGRLARTIRKRSYPQAGDSLDPAGFVWTRAPDIFHSYMAPRVLRASADRIKDSLRGGSMLAIPTLQTPRVGRRRMTPEEVEIRFNQDLILRPGKNGNWVALVDVNFGNWSRPTRMSRYGRQILSGRNLHKPRPKTVRLVHMFTLVRQVRTRKRWDAEAIARRAEAVYPALLSKHWS